MYFTPRLFAKRDVVAMNTRSNRLSADLVDIDKAIMAHRHQIEKLTLRRREILKELGDADTNRVGSNITDIQDLIEDFKENNPTYRTSELKEYLLRTLENDYSIGIVESYPMVDAAINNELFRYRLKRR